MSIIIKGLKLPEIPNNHGVKAEIRVLDGKLTFGLMTGGYRCCEQWRYFPVEQLPPHGDLIERDAASLSDFEIAICDGSFMEGMKMLLEKIDNAPTIIEAEGDHGVSQA